MLSLFISPFPVLATEGTILLWPIDVDWCCCILQVVQKKMTCELAWYLLEWHMCYLYNATMFCNVTNVNQCITNFFMWTIISQ